MSETTLNRLGILLGVALILAGACIHLWVDVGCPHIPIGWKCH
jgi:hypothetical protein